MPNRSRLLKCNQIELVDRVCARRRLVRRELQSAQAMASAKVVVDDEVDVVDQWFPRPSPTLLETNCSLDGVRVRRSYRQ